MTTEANETINTVTFVKHPVVHHNFDINQQIEIIKDMCITYSKAQYLSHEDVVTLMMHMLIVKIMDPLNVSQNLNFVKLVFNRTNLTSKMPTFVCSDSVTYSNKNYDKLESTINELISTKSSRYSVCYWDGITYKDGISFQIYGAHNFFGNVSPSICYEEHVKQYNLPHGKIVQAKIYEQLF